MENKENSKAKNEVSKANNSFSNVMMRKVGEIASTAGSALSVTDKSFAQDIILSTYKRMVEENIDPSKINFMGCNFPGQVKRYARLGLSLNENEIYLDIRNNGKSGKKDINIKMQYQGEEKLLTKFCQKNGGVINIIKDVIMEDEELVSARDFKTGNYVITDHKIPNLLKRNITTENKDKLIGAYAIAYHKDGSQTSVIIDKDRINRAEKAAQTKIVWNSDYRKMVLKTVIHELYKELAKFNVIPDELKKDYTEMILNKEEVQSEIDQNANSEVFEADFNIKDDNHNEDDHETNFNKDTGEVINEEPIIHHQQEVGGPDF